MNFKWISDLDRNGDGTKFGIEWENEDGYRYWDWYDSEAEREAALTEYKMETITYEDEYEQVERQMEILRMEMYVDYYFDNPTFLDDYSVLQVLNYLSNGSVL